MHGPDCPKQDKDRQPPVTWWAEKAKQILHPVQRRIIEVLWRTSMPLDAFEIAAMVGHDSIDCHLDRLLEIEAIAYAGDAVPPRERMQATFRLVLEQPSEN